MSTRNTVNTPTKFAGAGTPLERARDINFGKRLKTLIADRNLTASDVAASIWDRHRNSKGAWVAKGRDRLSVWINGKAFPDHDNLVKLAKALGVAVADLAPDAELKHASRATPKRSLVASDDYPAGQVFVQIAQFMPSAVAQQIFDLLRMAENDVQREQSGTP